MRRVLFLSAAMLAGASGAAWADCTAETRVTSGLLALLGGNRIQATGGTNSWNEFHGPGSTLTECALGPGSTVDPSHPVGTWQVVPGGGGDAVQYDYGTGGKYIFNVHQNGGANDYSFCNILTPMTESARGSVFIGGC